MSEPTDPGEPARDDPRDDLVRNSTLVAAGIGLSRVAGLGREMATAHFLGTGVGAEAFRAALRIPNLLQNLLGEGVLSASFIPVYSRLLAEGRDEEAGRLAGAIAGLLLVVTTVIVVVAVVLAEPIVRITVWGFEPGTERYDLTVTLVRILTPGVGFLVLSAWCLGVLNSHRRFFLSYVAPVVWNATMIAALVGTGLLVTGTASDLARALAVGAVVGSVLQFGVQLPSVLRVSRGLRLRLGLAVPGVTTVVSRFGQVLAGRGGVQLAGYVDLFVASLLAFGAVAALGYAQILYLLPIGLFGMSVAAAELPAMSTMDQDDRRVVTRRIDDGLERVAFFVLPSAVAFVVIGDVLVSAIYRPLAGGRFGPDAAAQVGVILGVYALGMLASTSTRLLQSALYGAGDARSPALYAVVRVVVSLAIGIAIMFPLDAWRISTDGIELVGEVSWSIADRVDRLGPDNLLRLGAAGLAFGAAVGAWLEYGLLRSRVARTFGRVRLAGRRGRELAIAAAGAAVVAVAVRIVLARIGLAPWLEGVLAVLVVGGTHVAVSWTLGVGEARRLVGSLTGRVRTGPR